jgi:hypothetical protein
MYQSARYYVVGRTFSLSKMFSCLRSLFGNGILMICLFYGGVMQNSSRRSMLFLTPVLSIWDLLCNLIHVKSVFMIFWSCVKIMFYTLIFTGNRLIVTVRWGLIVVNHFPWKNSLPYSQFWLIKIICKKQLDFDRNMAKTQRKFKERGYKNSQINTAIEKILNKTRHDLFRGHSHKNKHSCIQTTRYSKCSEQIKKIVHKQYHTF